MRQLRAPALATVAMAVLITTLTGAASSLAQEDPQPAADPEMAAALAALRQAQATVDSLTAAQTVDRVQAAADTLFPELLATGVQLRPHRADPLYVEVAVPYARSSDAGQLMWREALVSARATGVPMHAVEHDGWTWAVHQVNARTVLAAFQGVIAPPPTQEE